jgi:hypothetical protein
MEMQAITINAVAFEQDGAWVVQALEYDICAHADDPTGVPRALIRAIVENICICRELGREPLEGIAPAPGRFREMFERAGTELRSVRDQLQVPVSAMAIRLAEPARA